MLKARRQKKRFFLFQIVFYFQISVKTNVESVDNNNNGENKPTKQMSNKRKHKAETNKFYLTKHTTHSKVGELEANQK